MKTKVDKIVDKKGKKRLLSETPSPIKSNLKQESINELKKSPKKIKLADTQQNPASEEKVSKVGNKIKQQSSTAKLLEIKKDTKEKTELTVKSKKEPGRSKRRRPYNNLNLSVEQIMKKIEEIKSRETLSKRAKKILGVLNRKLRECGNESGKLDTAEKKSKKAEHPTDVSINNKKAEHRANISKNEKKVNDNKKVEKYIQSKNKLQEEDDDDDDDDDDDSDAEEDKDSDVEEESEEDESDESKVKNELSFTTDEKDDDESDEDEEDEEAENEEDEEDDDEEVESEEDEEVQGEEDEEDEDDEDEEDDEDDDEEENKKTIIKKPIPSEARNKKIQNANEQEQDKNKQERNNNKQEQNKNKQEQNKNKQFSDNEQKGELKKKRYVLFVGNLPLK